MDDECCEKWRSETGLDVLLRHAVEEATATLRRERDEAREAVKRRIELHVSECASLDDLVRHIASERDEARALVGRLADALERIADDVDRLPARHGLSSEVLRQALASIPPTLRRPAGEPA